ncbi:hypothetical protein NPIL_280781 [Nephila pilipes]|uniref:Uncharacterized protein n=1 Tax=Nephila pilipes TaxID=299642 RepID=A0A8X6II35_NEPPI|nr:hypothetical protein NPIL_280781 [Nephila pilipes]
MCIAKISYTAEYQTMERATQSIKCLKNRVAKSTRDAQGVLCEYHQAVCSRPVLSMPPVTRDKKHYIFEAISSELLRFRYSPGSFFSFARVNGAKLIAKLVAGNPTGPKNGESIIYRFHNAQIFGFARSLKWG